MPDLIDPFARQEAGLQCSVACGVLSNGGHSGFLGCPGVLSGGGEDADGVAVGHWVYQG